MKTMTRARKYPNAEVHAYTDQHRIWPGNKTDQTEQTQ